MPDHGEALQDAQQRSRSTVHRSGGPAAGPAPHRPPRPPTPAAATGPISAAASSALPTTSVRRTGSQRLERDHAEAPEQLDQRPARRPPGNAAPAAARRRSRPALRGPRRAARPARGPGAARSSAAARRPATTTWTRIDTSTGTVSAEPARPGRGPPVRRQQGTTADGHAEHDTAAAQAALDVRARVGGQRMVDVPGLERPAVQRAIDALQQRRRRRTAAPSRRPRAGRRRPG